MYLSISSGENKSKITYGIKDTEFWGFFLRFLILSAKTVFQKGLHLYYEQQAMRTQLTGVETKDHSYQNIFCVS